MRLVILNQFFYPDHSATSQLMTELAESLVERGVEVTALAGRGRYSGGEKLARREVYKGVRIERAWATSFGKGSLSGRISDYLSFYIGATWALLRLQRHDVVMALTTPPLIGLVALVIGRLRRMRVVMLVQDVYPDIAVALGALPPHSLITKTIGWISNQTLKRSDRIVVLSESMCKRLTVKVGDDRASKIDIIHNWADGDDIRPLSRSDNPFIDKHDLADSFVVLFSGNFGRVNEFKTVLEAARILRDRKDVVFLFVGGGAKQSELEEFRQTHSLSNVRMLPYEPRQSLRYSLAAGEALLVTLAEGLAGLSVPSKTYAIMAAGRPLLFVGDRNSDVIKIIEEYSCGAIIESGDATRLAEVVVAWASNKSEVKKLGAAARLAFEKRFDRPHAVDAYLATFAKCINLSAAPPEIYPQKTGIKDTAL